MGKRSLEEIKQEQRQLERSFDQLASDSRRLQALEDECLGYQVANLQLVHELELILSKENDLAALQELAGGLNRLGRCLSEEFEDRRQAIKEKERGLEERQDELANERKILYQAEEEKKTRSNEDVEG